MSDADDFWGAPIHVYTRAQALDDGTLIDVSKVAREAGFTVPVAVTANVWNDCVAWDDADTARQTYQDESGRLWDVLWMAYVAARRAPGTSTVLPYQLFRIPRGGHARKAVRTTLHMHIGPGDAGEPVITIGLPGDD